MRRWLIPSGVFALLVASALGDHYFRDEFYYLACSHRMDWGYVDHPPLCIALLWLIRHAAGDSLLTLRIAAAVVAAVTVWLTGSIARRLGAGGYGETLGMTAMGLAPVLLASASFYSMNVIDVFVWTLAARVLIAILDRPVLSRWILLGVVLGLGLENKISVLWLGAGVAAGLLLTPARRLLRTPGPWLAAAVAGALFAPHVLWQIGHGWPTLEFIRNASQSKMQAKTPMAFVIDQVITMNPLLLPVWLGGLLYLLFATHAARYRALAIAFLTVAAILMLNRTSRSGYLSPTYPMLFAAGGVAAERAIALRGWRLAVIVMVIAAGAISAPSHCHCSPSIAMRPTVAHSAWRHRRKRRRTSDGCRSSSRIGRDGIGSWTRSPRRSTRCRLPSARQRQHSSGTMARRVRSSCWDARVV